MKIFPALLAASLAANLVLAGVFLARRAGAGEAAARATAAASAPSAAAVAPAVVAPPPGAEFLRLTPEQLRDRLRTLDLPRNVVEQLLKARLEARVQARTHELIAAALKTAPPWKLVGLTFSRLSILTPAERKEIRDLEAEARDATLRLLGPGPADPSGRIAAKYGFVSPTKAVQLDALEADYENLTEQWKDETSHLRTPADKDREKFIKTEKERDLAALLTPAEREAFDLRASPTAKNTGFQARLAAFEPTEAEYRALFALQKAADDLGPARMATPSPKIAPGSPGVSMMSMSGGTSEPAADQLRAALGDARYADWQLATQPYYQSLVRVAATANLPAETTKRLGLAVSGALDESWRIADDLTMTGPQKKTAVIDLAGNLRAQLNNGLGAGATDALLKNARWFDALTAGSAVQVAGNTMAFRPVDPPPRSTPPPGPGR